MSVIAPNIDAKIGYTNQNTTTNEDLAVKNGTI